MKTVILIIAFLSVSCSQDTLDSILMYDFKAEATIIDKEYNRDTGQIYRINSRHVVLVDETRISQDKYIELSEIYTSRTDVTVNDYPGSLSVETTTTYKITVKSY